MGNSSSKVASRAAGAAKRQYPSAVSSAVSKPSQASPQPEASTTTAAAQVHPSPSQLPPSSSRSEVVELDARDPHFAASLARAGTARRVPQPPSPSSSSASPSSAFPTSSQPPKLQQSPTGQSIFPTSRPGTNPALAVVQARDKLTKQFEAEGEGLGRKSFAGRTLLNARELREALNLRDAAGEAEAESAMRLRKGLLAAMVTTRVASG
ncbi:uncharacterized protein HMPREF1541_06888 [Cyphellophora europaea CBS 101466]|uniref:Uncharacterized protein n=1 Tax=Cyphellophora europaea (strain CBS 101466) TaxID=1220924 RepID=W2RQV7_CYPE1|nr:uncharacterized protein HMPREF1541_06888 [Cyphellophora europaea CBS 101466]ETN38847.1 hypothetical protein HMPREF1541_06888 [Cyphellophora europaea CBS 101466]